MHDTDRSAAELGDAGSDRRVHRSPLFPRRAAGDPTATVDHLEAAVAGESTAHGRT